MDQQPVICLMGPTALDRLAYRGLIREHCRVDAVVESGYAPVQVWAALRERPDLVIAMVDNPLLEIRDAVQMIPKLNAGSRILILSAAVDPQIVSLWSECRVDGYVVKDAGVPELCRAIDALLHNQSFYSAGVRAALTNHRPEGKSRLSRREKELLPLLARGLTLREAAGRMTVSYKTADSYRTSLLRKLGVKDRVGLARYAIRERIIEA